MPRRRNRKTVQIGGITHTTGRVFTLGKSVAVTLPHGWVKEHNIQPGDVLSKVANDALTIVIQQKPV